MAFCTMLDACYWSSICETYRQILLVGENQKNGIPQLILVQHALQFLSGLDNTITIVAIDNKDDALSVLEVMPPQRPNFVLSSNIPDSELDILILDRLDVEAWGGERLAYLQRQLR